MVLYYNWCVIFFSPPYYNAYDDWQISSYLAYEVHFFISTIFESFDLTYLYYDSMPNECFTQPYHHILKTLSLFTDLGTILSTWAIVELSLNNRFIERSLSGWKGQFPTQSGLKNLLPCFTFTAKENYRMIIVSTFTNNTLLYSIMSLRNWY